MNREERTQLFKEIEETRNSKIIVFITGDRRHLETKIGDDVIPIFQNILINSNHKKKIELLIYSRGGDGSTALTIVSLIREYCNEFGVIVPWRAHSAATLIALGSNSILMLKSGQLSPVDVNITTPFNPTLNSPIGPKYIPINVEDLSGYINFSKDILEIKNEENLTEVLRYLTEQINPLAIGAVHRAREKNSKIASSLLKYHMDDDALIKKISDIITMGLYEHSYLISRRDAINLKLPVEKAPDELERKIWTLFTEYLKILELDQLYILERLIGDDIEKDIEFHRAIIEYIEDENLQTYTFTTKRKLIRRDLMDPVLKVKLPNIMEKDLDDGWIINNDI